MIWKLHGMVEYFFKLLKMLTAIFYVVLWIKLTYFHRVHSANWIQWLNYNWMLVYVLEFLFALTVDAIKRCWIFGECQFTISEVHVVNLSLIDAASQYWFRVKLIKCSSKISSLMKWLIHWTFAMANFKSLP